MVLVDRRSSLAVGKRNREQREGETKQEVSVAPVREGETRIHRQPLVGPSAVRAGWENSRNFIADAEPRQGRRARRSQRSINDGAEYRATRDADHRLWRGLALCCRPEGGPA